MPTHFTIQKKGPTTPEGVDGKFFNSVKADVKGNIKFKAGDVVKVTAGKIRLRDEEEKGWKEGNNETAEKGDIIQVTGPIYGENPDSEQHFAARVFRKK